MFGRVVDGVIELRLNFGAGERQRIGRVAWHRVCDTLGHSCSQ
jgi:hypothetical protein